MKAEVNDWYPGKVPASAYYAIVENSDPAQLNLPLAGDDEFEAVA
jgi:hypothetical protein